MVGGLLYESMFYFTSTSVFMFFSFSVFPHSFIPFDCYGPLPFILLISFIIFPCHIIFWA